MNECNVVYTVRLYSGVDVARVGRLWEGVRDRFRNKNEFMTALVLLGVRSYIEALEAAGGGDVSLGDVLEGGAGIGACDQNGANGTLTVSSDKASLAKQVNLAGIAGIGGFSEGHEEIEELKLTVNNMTQNVAFELKRLAINDCITHQLLSSCYNILACVNEGQRLMARKVDDGFYDDLPERFEQVRINLETHLGVK